MSTNMMRGYGMVSPEAPGWLEKERPVCGPLDAILRPTLVAPCTSDTHVMHGGAGYKKDLILGHEAIGEVVEVGQVLNVTIQSVEVERGRISLGWGSA